MNKMDSSIKSLIITGGAAEDATRSRRPNSRKRRSTRQEDDEFLDKVKELSNDASRQVPIIKLDSKVHPKVDPKVDPKVEPKIEPKVDPKAEIKLESKMYSRFEPKVEPKIESKVEIKLEPKVERTEIKKPESVYDGTPSVILKPAKSPRVKLQPKMQNTSHPQPTRKARKFRLSVSSLNHRFTRAKRVKDDTENKTMGSIREYLIKKGVIQDKSKAPEKMLRSMYRDFMLLKDTAL